MTKYEKYRVTVTGKDGEEMVLFIPWSTLEDEVSLFLTNCYTVTIDGGVLTNCYTVTIDGGVMAKEED